MTGGSARAFRRPAASARRCPAVRVWACGVRLPLVHACELMKRRIVVSLVLSGCRPVRRARVVQLLPRQDDRRHSSRNMQRPAQTVSAAEVKATTWKPGISGDRHRARRERRGARGPDRRARQGNPVQAPTSKVEKGSSRPDRRRGRAGRPDRRGGGGQARRSQPRAHRDAARPAASTPRRSYDQAVAQLADRPLQARNATRRSSTRRR